MAELNRPMVGQKSLRQRANSLMQDLHLFATGLRAQNAVIEFEAQ